MNVGKLRKILNICTVFCAFALMIACGGNGEQSGERILSSKFIDSVKVLTVKSPDSALNYISQVAKTGSVSKDTIHFARASVYTKTYEMDKMKGELLAIIDSSNLDHKSRLYLSSLRQMAELCVFTAQLEDAIKYNLQGDSLSYAANDKRMQAEFHNNMGICVLQRDNELAKRYLKEAIVMYEDVPEDTTIWQNVITASLYLMNIYVMELDYPEAIKLGERLQYQVDSISVIRDFNKFDSGNTIRASICGLMCISYAGVGNQLDAGMAYAKCQQYHSESPSIPLLLANCLLAMERVDEAIVQLESIRSGYHEKGDTLNYEYADNLNSLKACYKEVGDLKKALECSEKEMAARKGLFSAELKTSVTEWEIRYKMREKESELRDATKDTRIIRLAAILLVGLLAVAVIFIFMFVRYNRILNVKNKALAMQISKDLSDKNIEKAKEKEAAKHKEKAEAEIVPEAAIEQIHQFVDALVNQKLFCDSNLDKDALMTELNLNKRLVSRYFETVMGKSYVKFLAVKRVEYAADQIRQFPNYTIEAIAADSGIASRATFYRLFSDHFGISPTDYRRQCLSMGPDEG